ncbi:thiamine biosynthesis lipoprotein [Salinihabitans flavidus]|uniref:FAD:protein FMN transferase n=1 Tax=Salinihabitans flavidus TaxID=569882 RepID=A0A1H8S142_9RHOB|nr:FAD:protein FMN transferase [Salinihabitans flavidus]SEO71893.1 thiamine biosynthesis lipoprotein [Salinihabitans flavidus]
MTGLSRRRFLTISACAAGLAGRAQAATEITQWRGMALGARVTLTLSHPQAAQIAEEALAEIDRLEDVFSLYRAESALMRLNAAGRLDAPPFELLECLSLCNTVHEATGGLFDPTVQPLWQAYARHYSNQAEAEPHELERARGLVGWSGVSFDAGQVRFAKAGMALTLNGIAQGHIADRIGAMLAERGLRDTLVDTGEFRALGGHPGGGDWPVTLRAAGAHQPGTLGLRDAALAVSAPRGTVFDAEATAGHILDPRSGQPAQTPWRLICVTGRSAALADGLSTGMCLMDRRGMQAALRRFDGMALAHLS